MSTPALNTALKTSYQRLFDTMKINPAKLPEITAAVTRITYNKRRYQAIEQITGVPWFFVGLLHTMESGNNFAKHLHNGDPLTGRTVNVPEGRPRTGQPPFTFEQSAIDALNYMQEKNGAWRATKNDWSLPAMLYKLEAYNGFGYRSLRTPINTPYLWSYTNHYTKGKYVADGRYDPNAVSKQPGTAAMLATVLQQNNLLSKYKGGGLPGLIAAFFGLFFS